MEYDKLTKVQIKKLQSIERRMLKINNEIKAMGFNVYLANDTCNIMDGPAHDDTPSHSSLTENIRHSFTLRGWDGGDW